VLQWGAMSTLQGFYICLPKLYVRKFCIGLGEEDGADVTMIIPKPIPYEMYSVSWMVPKTTFINYSDCYESVHLTTSHWCSRDNQ